MRHQHHNIRPAKFGDILRLRDLARELHAASRYREYPEDEKAFKETCVETIRSGNHCLLVAEVDGSIEGFLIGITDKLYHFTRARYATDIVTYVSEPGRGAFPLLVEAFQEWAWEQRGVEEVWLAATDAVEDWARVGAVLERGGFAQMGAIYRTRKVP